MKLRGDDPKAIRGVHKDFHLPPPLLLPHRRGGICGLCWLYRICWLYRVCWLCGCERGCSERRDDGGDGACEGVHRTRSEWGVGRVVACLVRHICIARLHTSHTSSAHPSSASKGLCPASFPQSYIPFHHPIISLHPISFHHPRQFLYRPAATLFMILH